MFSKGYLCHFVEMVFARWKLTDWNDWSHSNFWWFFLLKFHFEFCHLSKDISEFTWTQVQSKWWGIYHSLSLSISHRDLECNKHMLCKCMLLKKCFGLFFFTTLFNKIHVFLMFLIFFISFLKFWTIFRLIFLDIKYDIWWDRWR